MIRYKVTHRQIGPTMMKFQPPQILMRRKRPGEDGREQEVSFRNEQNDQVTCFRAMVASRNEILTEYDILARIKSCRADFVNKVMSSISNFGLN